MKMLRFGDIACLIAPGFPGITLVNLGRKAVCFKNAEGMDKSVLPQDITFDQAIEMVEESAQTNLDQALTLLAGKIKGSWQAK